tara:strand:- start:1656 stop:1895 length:240 start_codon:yes stop_codon:yes gene_type:complete
MSVPIRAMHDEVKENYLGAAEAMIEADEDFHHDVADRDSIRLAYILWAEAGNPDLWDEARENWDAMRIQEKNEARANAY